MFKSFSPLPELSQAVAEVEGSELVHKDWIYAPPRIERNWSREEQRPFPSRIFELPRTHLIEHAACDGDDHLTFLLWALSFFTGTRLTATEAGFLDATPIKPGVLVDFVLPARALPAALALADGFWAAQRAAPERRRLFAAAVHALFLGQNPLLLQFERFTLFYTAFDACFTLAKSLHGTKKSVIHAERVAWMCGQFAMPVPAWADQGNASQVAILRNAAVHEALFVGEPLGFAVHEPGTGNDITLQMQALICRLLVALLGSRGGSYVGSAVDSRQRMLLEI